MEEVEKQMNEKTFGQWKVDVKGNIKDTLGYEYWIAAERVCEPDWEEHMRLKSWVNIIEFNRALNYARNLVNPPRTLFDTWDTENSKKIALEEFYGNFNEVKEICGHISVDNTHSFEGPLGKILEDSLYDHGKSIQQLGWDIITAALIKSGDPKLIKLGLERMKESERRKYYTG